MESERGDVSKGGAFHQSVQEVPVTCEQTTKGASREKKIGADSKEEADTSKAAVCKSKAKCELRISEDLDDFADVGQKKENEPVEIPPPPEPKVTKRPVTEPKPVSKNTPMRKKLEPKNIGPVKNEEASFWNGFTLNRCLLIAAFAALLSVGFQVLQEATDNDDELTEVDEEHWIQPNPNNPEPDQWFFEGWFGSSDAVNVKIPEEDLPEEELPGIEEDELVMDGKTTVEETVKEKEEVATESLLKKSKKWGLKEKSNYMAAKAIKIRRAPEGSHKIEVFPFKKKQKEPIKYSPDGKQKLHKERQYQGKGIEHKYGYSKMQNVEKPYKKGREEHKKYFEEEKEWYKGKKVDKAAKGYRGHQQEKEYKKSKDNRRHG
ncbi:hypothetical protein GDO86_001099 [Hymenochirus boettgeri]|uniref:Junctional sarcoplasmic reticulum protein 1 n=1 Tax=Hymenochirus boettgeri TaxID=247094 RepID=A0A8T2KBC5_9PIPI|nr:hypothetical protein GDO86_001099 [Hymenochirus boettgeri]